MNYVFISPSFPSNYKHFAIQLKAHGVNVLGIGSDPYDTLEPALKKALTEYYRVKNMENYEEMLQACAFLTYKYGKIHRIESHNEHWLAQDARLRTDFNVPGFQGHTIERIKHKSKMKEVFRQVDIPVARGAVFHTLEEAQKLVAELGYPVCVKPDSGVGAMDTYKIRNEEELTQFFGIKPPVPYIMEEFIEGEIHTFDGLVDRDGRAVFTSSLIYGSVMDMVNEQLDTFYYMVREIPEDLVDYGMKALKAFDLRERFFHFEFFRKPDGTLVALEINARPPGGWTVDMFNFANDMDIYDQYAKVVTENTFDADAKRPYFCAYVGLKDIGAPLYSQEEIFARYGTLIIHQGPIASIFAPAIGNYGYVLRSPELAPLQEAAQTIMARA